MRKFVAIGVAVVALAGCGSTASSTSSSPPKTTPGGLDAAAITWAGQIGTNAGKISQDFSAVGDTSASSQATEANLQTLQTDVAAFQAFLNEPIPPFFMASAATMKEALQDYQSGTAEALTAFETNDSSGLSTAISDLSSGNALLDQASSQINSELAGGTPPA